MIYHDQHDGMISDQKQTIARLERELAMSEALMVRWRAAFQDVTPGGSEFMSPESVRDYAQKLKNETVAAKLDRAKMQKSLAECQAQAADEKMMRKAQEDSLNRCCKARALAEAHAAAMRETLELAIAALEGK